MLDRTKRLLKLQNKKGQSMVEVAVALPLLLMMFLGVFEVGWAVRSYVVMVNTNRETARFAVKNNVLDFSIKDPETVGYHEVLTHTMFSVAAQVPFDLVGDEPNASMILSHIVVDAAFPCVRYQGNDPVVPYEFDPNCDCRTGDPSDPDGDGTSWFSRDDLVAHPGDPEYPHYLQTFGITATTRIEGGYAGEAEKLREASNQLNCTLLKTGAVASQLPINNILIAEMIYEQPHLMGAPIISNRLTDPVPLYGHTAMRIVPSREDDTQTSIGPTCELYPFTFPEDLFAGYDPDNPPPGGFPIDAFEGSGSGNFGWLTWDPDPSQNDANYLAEQLANPRLSMYDFTNTSDPNDHSLSLGDDISSGTGTTHSSDVDALLQGLEGKVIRVPVYSSGGGGGQNASYTVSHFALIKVEQICIPGHGNQCDGNGSDKQIKATFLGYDDEACAIPGGGGGSHPGNNPPLAIDDSAATNRNVAVTISVLSNDSDPDSHALHITDTTPPSNGTITIDGLDIDYDPNNGFTGTDSFSYTISDGFGGTDTATVTVTVTAGGGANNPPVASSDTATTDESVAVTVNVISNDTDPDSDPLTVTGTTTPANGSVTNNGDGTITYTPDNGYSGNDSFNYTISDGNGGTATATVNVTINAAAPVNTPPVANADTGTTDEDVAVTIDVIGNDSDADSDQLTVTNTTAPGHGSVTNNNDGTLTYTPVNGYTGPDSFSYTISDGNGGEATTTVSITVNAVVVPAMHVHSITVTVSRSGSNYRGTAVVTIVDANNNPVPGAQVSGSWSGPVSDGDTATTDSSGQISVRSNRKRSSTNPGAFHFCVTSVTKNGWTYDQPANVVNCGDGTYP